MKKLFIKISGGILLALIFSIVANGLVFHMTGKDRFEGRLDSIILGQASYVRDQLETVPQDQFDSRLAELQKKVIPTIKILSFQSAQIPQTMRSALASDNQTIARSDEPFPTSYFCLRSCTEVVALIPDRPPGPPFNLSDLFITIAVVIPIVAIVGFALAFPIVRRLQTLEKATIRIRNGDLGARANLDASDAVGQLAGLFNQMAERIQALLEDRQNLLQAVSHELRTPISRIGFNLEILAAAADEDERQEQIREMEEELEALSKLVSNLLLYMRYDSSRGFLPKEEIPISRVCSALIEQIQSKRSEIEISFQNLNKDAAVYANEVSFKLAFQNLLSNAVRYASHQVIIRIDCQEGKAIIDVIDDGPGIPQKEQRNLFRPFFRADSSRSRYSGGVGLGLAIVERIVWSHGGSISYRQGETGQGACFTIAWPASCEKQII